MAHPRRVLREVEGLCTLVSFRKEPLTVENGMMQLPDKPGFGVELIADVEKKFPYVPLDRQPR